MKTFKTQQEIWQALIDGKSIRHHDWNEKDLHIKLVDGLTTMSDESNSHYSFRSPCDWSIYEEPKKTKRVYQAIFKHRDDNYCFISERLYENEEEITHYLTCNDFVKLVEPGFEVEI